MSCGRNQRTRQIERAAGTKLPYHAVRAKPNALCGQSKTALRKLLIVVGGKRWAAAEEGQGWRRQQRARASLRSSCAPQEGSNMRTVALDGPSQSCFITEAACVSSCKQHKPSRANSQGVPPSEVSPRFHQQAHSGLMTSTCCPYERSVAVTAHKRMRREQPQNNANAASSALQPSSAAARARYLSIAFTSARCSRSRRTVDS